LPPLFLLPATFCNILHHTAPHCTTLHHAAPHCTTLHHTAPHCTALHHTATAVCPFALAPLLCFLANSCISVIETPAKWCQTNLYTQVPCEEHAVRVEGGEGGGGGGLEEERFSCSLTPNLKQVGVITGDRVRYAPILGGDMAGAESSVGRRL